MKIFKKILEHGRHYILVTNEYIRHQKSCIAENVRHDSTELTFYEDIKHGLIVAAENTQHEGLCVYEDARHEANLIAIDLLGHDIG